MNARLLMDFFHNFQNHTQLISSVDNAIFSVLSYFIGDSILYTE